MRFAAMRALSRVVYPRVDYATLSKLLYLREDLMSCLQQYNNIRIC